MARKTIFDLFLPTLNPSGVFLKYAYTQ